MRFKEYLSQQEVFEAVLPLLLLDEDGPPEVPNLGIEPTPPKGPIVTSPTGGWGKGPFNPYGGGHKWFGELYNTVKQYAVASRIADRLKQLGIKGSGVDRIANARNSALMATRDLLTNPRATAYRIPVWTTKKPPKVAIKIWNEEFAKAFRKELLKEQ